MNELLRLEDLTIGYNNIPLIRDINISQMEGEIIAIAGLNGSGKSTLFKTIIGTIKPISGFISYSHERIEEYNLVKRKRLGINLAPEGRQIFPNLTVLENMITGLAISNITNDERSSRIQEMFSIFPKLEQRKSQLGGSLSGGEQQMLSIVRALISKPKLLMLDEPTLGISPIIIDDIIAKIDEISKTGVSFIIADQKIERFNHIVSQKLYITNKKIEHK